MIRNGDVNKMTKFQRGLYENHQRARFHTIWEAYEKPSYAKEKAYHDCVRKAEEKGAYEWAIPSRNTFQFSFSAIYPDKETGELRMMYETACNSYDFAI